MLIKFLDFRATHWALCRLPQQTQISCLCAPAVTWKNSSFAAGTCPSSAQNVLTFISTKKALRDLTKHVPERIAQTVQSLNKHPEDGEVTGKGVWIFPKGSHPCTSLAALIYLAFPSSAQAPSGLCPCPSSAVPPAFHTSDVARFKGLSLLTCSLQ